MSRIGFISSHLRYYIMKLTQYFLKLSTFIKTKTRTKPVEQNSTRLSINQFQSLISQSLNYQFINFKNNL